MKGSKKSLIAAELFFASTLLQPLASLVLAAVFAATSPGSPGGVNAVLNRLQQHYQETESFSAKFDETITRPGVPPLQRSGNISYKKPGKLRWEFGSSQPETIVSDGKTIYDYDPGLNQVVETPLAQAVRSQAAAAFLLGAGDLKRDFTVQNVTEPDSSRIIRLNLTPKNGSERIEAGLDAKTYNVVALSIKDAMGNATYFRFSNIELNPPLQASRFTFTPPDGVDIVSGGGPH